MYNELRDLGLSLALATFILGFCIFTTTYPAHNASLKWFRLAVAIPLTLLWVKVGLSIHHPVSVYAHYVALRAIEVCVIGFWDAAADVPRWIVRKEKTGENAEIEWVQLPLPTTLKGRVAYAADSLMGWRGASLFYNHDWSWATKPMREYQPPRTRLDVLKRLIRNVLINVLLLDVAETIISRYPWDTSRPDPITSLPIQQQIPSTVALGICTGAGTDMCFQALNFVLSFSFGFPAYAPYLAGGGPLHARSLSDAWSHRWHIKFKRVFNRLSLPVVWLLNPHPNGPPSTNRFTINLIRCFVVFGLSTFLHLGIYLALVPSPHIHRSFWHRGTIMFFMSQPLGLALEIKVVNPLTERLSERWKMLSRRVYFWVWIFWTGRWFADGNVLYGVLEHQSIFLLDSLIKAFTFVTQTFSKGVTM